MCVSRFQSAGAGFVAAALAVSASAQTLNVTPSTDAVALAEELLGPGVNLVPGSVQFVGAANQQGFFTKTGGDVIGFDDGILLTSGAVQNVPGPNVEVDVTTSLNTPGDAALSALSGFQTFDANILQFRFTVDPNVTALGFNYVFASDEYNEFVGTQFNDVFAFFVDGQNVALIPGTSDAVAINSVNDGNPNNLTPPSNAAFYVNNDPNNPPLVPPGQLRNTEMDGFTTVLFADVFAALNPNLTEHTIRFAIADASDANFDSAVFIQGGSFTTPLPTGGECQVGFEPAEPNDECVGPFGGQTIVMTDDDCLIINGKLSTCSHPGPQPDTWLCVYDKLGQLVVSDDNGSEFGNGKASGLLIGDGDGDGVSDILVNNGDGTYSLRIGVTGFPDGFDGNCNGFFQNAPHGQIGQFTVLIEYIDSEIVADPAPTPTMQRLAQLAATEGAPQGGVVIGTDTYTDEFITGAEAFLLNFTAPVGTELVRINIDNTTGMTPVCDDVDYMCVGGLDPFETYCITVVGGLDYDCNPTDTQLCWLDKDCNVLATDDDSGPAPGYSQLCVVSDVNGNICFAVSGGGDDDCDGWVLDEPHGVCGTYSIQVRRASDMVAPAQPGCTPEQEAAMALAAQGDLNGDGLVNGDDLSRLLSNWGLATAP